MIWKKIYEEQLEVNDENFVPLRFEQVQKLLGRKKSSILPVNPKNFEEVILEGEWTKTLKDQDFVFFQEKKIICAIKKWSILQEVLFYYWMVLSKQLLQLSFKYTPYLRQKKNWKIPIVWGFLGEKPFFFHFFSILTQKSNELFGCSLIPYGFKTDFESGVISAVKKVFSLSQHMECWFHYSLLSIRISKVSRLRFYFILSN